MGTRDATRGRYNGFDESRLCCYGCANSSVTEPWPGQPSNERPCLFCIRNPLQHMADEDQMFWYDGSEPVSVPMDCYTPVDMRKQTETWIATAKKEDTEALQRVLESQRKLKDMIDDESS